MSKKPEIDLRSDTVTKPTEAMLDAMFHAEVGDDVLKKIQTYTRLEKKAAEIFFKEEKHFCSIRYYGAIKFCHPKVLTQPRTKSFAISWHTFITMKPVGCV